MKIIYTRKAKRDLSEIHDHYGPRSQPSLENIVDDILGVTEALPVSISRGRKTPHPDVWEKISPKYGYVLPYHIHQGTLFILRVYDPRRAELDYKRIVDLKI